MTACKNGNRAENRRECKEYKESHIYSIYKYKSAHNDSGKSRTERMDPHPGNNGRRLNYLAKGNRYYRRPESSYAYLRRHQETGYEKYESRKRIVREDNLRKRT